MTIPTLTPRAAREQSTFRTLLNAMARPGTIARLDFAGANPLVVVAEALIDHEVTFAVVPERPELTEAILRQTGSHVADADVAEYVFCDSTSLELALNDAAEGTPEYPDAGATVVCLVPSLNSAFVDTSFSPSPRRETGQGSEVSLSGPGIRDTVTVDIEGFTPHARRAFAARNAARPLGLDLVFVTPDGDLVCLTRYTRIQEEE